MAATAPRISPAGWLRIAVRILAMLAMLVACLPLYYLWIPFAAHNPWPRRFLGAISRIAGVRVSVTGERSGGREFLLANHVSWIDVPALAGVSGAAFVAHDGLAGVPLVRWLCAMNRTVFVARHDRAGVKRQVELVRKAIAESGVLVIFPEGATGDGAGLLPIKSSLLSALDPLPAGVIVQPVLLDYGPEAGSIAWVGEEHGLDNFCRILARSKPVDLAVQFLPPLTDEALASRKTIAAATREAMLDAMQRR